MISLFNNFFRNCILYNCLQHKILIIKYFTPFFKNCVSQQKKKHRLHEDRVKEGVSFTRKNTTFSIDAKSYKDDEAQEEDDFFYYDNRVDNRSAGVADDGFSQNSSYPQTPESDSMTASLSRSTTPLPSETPEPHVIAATPSQFLRPATQNFGIHRPSLRPTEDALAPLVAAQKAWQQKKKNQKPKVFIEVARLEPGDVYVSI